MKFSIPDSYELVKEHYLKDIASDGYILKHKKTGARVVLLSNDDDNKVFYIGFRTPPTDSTGVAHILEHSVLCGSENFPVKDPFIELAQGSLNTFLNAMTYPDKTVYPVASCNLQDLKNLMHVYMDAVFYPNIHKESRIFAQEGWHYHLEHPEDELTINGVVYNEMKGAFSSADDVHGREVFNSLFPDNAYGVESGGDPDCIPDLTYEAFCDFHSRYYHPSNSYIYLYGDMDMAERLEWIDSEYLSRFDAITIDSEIRLQKPFEQGIEHRKSYPIGSDQSLSGNTYLSKNYVVGESGDNELYVAFKILDYAICSAPGAPLKKALTDAGIGTEIYSVYESSLRQPYFSIVAKNTDEFEKQRFTGIIDDVLSDLVNNGIDKKSLKAAINMLEFSVKEADFGSYPKGLMYGLQSLDSWLYDDEDPFILIESDGVFASLRSKMEQGYFESLIKTYLIDNTHCSLVVVAPDKDLAVKREAEFKASMKSYKDSLSVDEIQKLVDRTRDLAAYQEAEDSAEDIARLPLLSVGDIQKEINPFKNRLETHHGVRVLYHDYFTRGIAYLRFAFCVNNVPARLFPYLSIHRSLLALMDTENYSYGDLFNEVNTLTGGISGTIATSVKYDNFNEHNIHYEIGVKVLFENISEAFRLIKEIILTTKFSDKKRMKEILSELKSQLRASMPAAGHSTAVNRVMSSISPAGAINEMLSGIDGFFRLSDIEEHFDEKADELIAIMEEISACVFCPENLLLDVTMSEDAAESNETILSELGVFCDKLHREPCEKSGSTFSIEPVPKKEAFNIPSTVQYVALGGNFRNKGLSYTGAFHVLKVIMNYDYLWNRIRVKGGAYGCMSTFAIPGNCCLVTYRDPHLAGSLDTFREAADYIAGFEADERTMTKFIIGAFSNIDTPLTPAAKGDRSYSAFLHGVTDADAQRRRDEARNCTRDDIRALAEHIRAFISEDNICVLGSESKIAENRDIFDSVESLIKG